MEIKNIDMKIKDIIGENFTAVVFDSDNRLIYDSQYKEIYGMTGKIIETHSKYPEYTNIEFPNSMRLHFPTKIVIEQVEKNAVTEDINVVLARIERLTR